MLPKPNLIPRSGESFAFSVLLGVIRDGLLNFPIPLGISQLALRLGPRLALRLPALPLNLILALLRREFVLQASALEVSLGLLLLEVGFILALLRLGRIPLGLSLGLGLGLL